MNDRPLSPSSGIDGQPPLILIIEDEDILLQLETIILERAGYRICGFGSGDEALAAPPESIQEAKLALVDAVFGGVEVVQALRRINPHIKTAIVSAVELKPHPEVARFIRLPFRPEDLVRSVRELMA